MPPAQSTAYGWLMLAGIAVSLVFWMRMAKRDERLVIIYLAALCGAFLGAKLVYFAAEGWLFVHDPHRWRILATGKSILGALPGGYVAVEITKRLVDYRSATGDFFALVAPVGIGIGRIGCLLHGCCMGAICTPAWFTMRDQFGAARWPAAPVEIGFNLAALAAFLWLRAAKKLPGQHFHLYLIAYGLFRFAHEFLRDTPRMLGPLTGYQIAALAVAGLGAWGFAQRQRLTANLQATQTVSSDR